MEKIALKIEGMSCQHCVMHVRKAVEALPGIAKAEVQVGSAEVTFDETKVKAADPEGAMEKAGYKVVR